MKPAKPLWKISVITTREAEDAVAEMLGGVFNQPASSYYDFEKKRSRVTVFIPHKTRSASFKEVRAGLETIKTCGLDIGSGKISSNKVRREDWSESWKRHFKSIEIGGTLLLKPSWSKKRPRAGQVVVILNPGLSFGTGQHATTRFCLEAMVQNAKSLLKRKRAMRSPQPGPSFLDIGTGSGILAIAAARLGYHPVHALDFDPEAIRAARANVCANKVKIKLFHGDVARLPATPNRRFDFICANLISGLLVRERKRIAAQLKPGGILAVAGILKSEFTEVRQLFEKSGLKLISEKSEKEWRSGAFYLA